MPCSCSPSATGIRDRYIQSAHSYPVCTGTSLILPSSLTSKWSPPFSFIDLRLYVRVEFSPWVLHAPPISSPPIWCVHAKWEVTTFQSSDSKVANDEHKNRNQQTSPKNASDVHFGGAWFQSCPGALATWLRICGFPPFLPVNVGGVPRFGNYRLLTNPLQFIIHRYVVCDTDSVMKQITHTELHFQKQTTQVNLKSGSMTQSLHRETLMSFLGTAPVQLSDFAPGNMKRQGWRKR